MVYYALSEQEEICKTSNILELLTDRLRLKVLGPDFARQSLDYYTRNQAFLTEWNPTPAADFYTLAYHQERLRVELDLMKEGRLARFWLFKREDAAFTPRSAILRSTILCAARFNRATSATSSTSARSTRAS